MYFDGAKWDTFGEGDVCGDPILGGGGLLVTRRGDFISGRDRAVFRDTLHPLGGDRGFNKDVRRVGSVVVAGVGVLSSCDRVKQPKRDDVVVGLFFLRADDVHGDRRPFAAVFNSVLEGCVRLVVASGRILASVAGRDLVCPVVYAVCHCTF